jgi:hypothetical protein
MRNDIALARCVRTNALSLGGVTGLKYATTFIGWCSAHTSETKRLERPARIRA